LSEFAVFADPSDDEDEPARQAAESQARMDAVTEPPMAAFRPAPLKSRPTASSQLVPDGSDDHMAEESQLVPDGSDDHIAEESQPVPEESQLSGIELPTVADNRMADMMGCIFRNRPAISAVSYNKHYHWPG